MKIIKNDTAWHTADLARIIRRALRETKLTPQQRAMMRVTIKTRHGRRNPDFIGGSAPYHSTRFTLKLPPPKRAGLTMTGPFRDTLDIADIAATVVHEVWHCLGVSHRDMPEHIMWCHTTKLVQDGADEIPRRVARYPWTEKMTVRPKAKPVKRIADPIKVAEMRVAVWERKSKLAATKLKLWRRRLVTQTKRAAAREPKA